jgi:5-methylcytosine-specific restriction endonuclease McrA
VALRQKQRHPETGTRQHPNITEENRLKGLKNLTFRFPKGHSINKGIPSKLKGRKRDPEIVAKISAKNKGKKKGPVSDETRRKMSESQRKRHAGKDRTVAQENRFIREGIEIKLWREAVFKRDNWTCVACGKCGVYLHADHIKPFAYFPELRFDVSNGRALCVPCHKKTDTYMGRARARYEFNKQPKTSECDLFGSNS